MSIDLNWETLTTGPDGEALAHSIRDFIHTKFQSVPLPRFIKSVTVHDFEFGTTPPELELKDITDPLPDFYEENLEADDEDSDDEDEDDERHFDHDLGDEGTGVPEELIVASERRRRNGQSARLTAIPPYISTAGLAGMPFRGGPLAPMQDLGSPFLGTSTPGIPGGTSNLSYFHSHLMGGPSGTQTPLAAVAGAHLGNNNHHNHRWTPEAGATSPLSATTTAPFLDSMGRQRSVDGRASSHSRNPSHGSVSGADSHNTISGLTPIHLSNTALREKSSVSTFAPTSSAGTSRPPTRDNTNASTSMLVGSAITEDEEQQDDHDQKDQRRFREPRIEDIQAVFRIKYSGDVKLLLTADILLDYPMPSFVGIPLRLSITGLSFDGVGVVAHIRKRVHFCFLSPEDALAAVGSDGQEQAEDAPEGAGSSNIRPGKMGGLLQEIRVESEIGQREGGKQSLKNVGKVERFVLEQVRRIFEEEFVYPSFWTFLV
ncbi:Mitochondrial distribution and morphology protein 12 [Diaporthe australafricana]|uniref:Mitochondrial distribution and morphology protein 12 n=1 Tax=Diaporthe australafricana TaxID=127596 RepID=A0ABR3Y1Y1_9PEZI